jgi:ankyrin repeat protein
MPNKLLIESLKKSVFFTQKDISMISKMIASGSTAAHYCLTHESPEQLQELKTLNISLDEEDEDGFTPAFLAAYCWQTEMLTVFNKLGVDLQNRTDSLGRTAIFYAKEGQKDGNKNSETIKMLSTVKTKSSKANEPDNFNLFL